MSPCRTEYPDGDAITVRESPNQAAEARKLLSVLTDKRKAAVALGQVDDDYNRF